MLVEVVDRQAMLKAWGTPGPIVIIKRRCIISDRCPVCGGPRGVPFKETYYESGQHYQTDCWINPCGHIDSYADVIKESVGVK